MVKRLCSMCFVTVLLSTLPYTQAWAQDALKLKEIIITGSKIEEPLEHASVSATIITEQEIEKQHVTTAGEVLKNVGQAARKEIEHIWRISIRRPGQAVLHFIVRLHNVTACVHHPQKVIPGIEEITQICFGLIHRHIGGLAFNFTEMQLDEHFIETIRQGTQFIIHFLLNPHVEMLLLGDAVDGLIQLFERSHDRVLQSSGQQISNH